MQNQFERYIKKLLAQADANDALRAISNNTNGLSSAVNLVLIENELESLFAPPSEYTKSRKKIVLDKLYKIESILIIYKVPEDDLNRIIVKLCQRYINDGYGITIDIADLLNKIYKSYGK